MRGAAGVTQRSDRGKRRKLLTGERNNGNERFNGHTIELRVAQSSVQIGTGRERPRRLSQAAAEHKEVLGALGEPRTSDHFPETLTFSPPALVLSRLTKHRKKN